MLQQELRNKCYQASQAEDSASQLARDLRGARVQLAQSQQLACQCEEAVQELQAQLAAARAKVSQEQQAQWRGGT